LRGSRHRHYLPTREWDADGCVEQRRDRKSLVYHRYFTRLRTRMGDCRPRSGRQSRRHRARHRDIGRSGRQVRRRDSADPVGRHRSRRRLRRGQAGSRPLRTSGRRRQQRRLRAVRLHRGALRAGRPRPDRDEPLRRPLGDPGGAADHARAGLRPHHPGVLDRRRHRVPGSRPLPRLEVGAGGVQPVALARGRALRAPT